MKLALQWVGRTRDRRLEALSLEYIERIRRYCRIEIRELRETRGDSHAAPRERAQREGRRILDALRPGEHVVALDEGGRHLSSEEFAAFLGRALEAHPSGVAVVVGGPFGLSAAVRERASERVALSKMTLTHETARLIVLEQIYRAFTILRGGSYHH